jgi:hypothetical protein
MPAQCVLTFYAAVKVSLSPVKFQWVTETSMKFQQVTDTPVKFKWGEWSFSESLKLQWFHWKLTHIGPACNLKLQWLHWKLTHIGRHAISIENLARQFPLGKSGLHEKSWFVVKVAVSHVRFSASLKLQWMFRESLKLRQRFSESLKLQLSLRVSVSAGVKFQQVTETLVWDWAACIHKLFDASWPVKIEWSKIWQAW